MTDFRDFLNRLRAVIASLPTCAPDAPPAKRQAVLEEQRTRLASAFDEIGFSAVLAETDGRLLHATPAFGVLRAAEPEASTLHSRIQEAVVVAAKLKMQTTTTRGSANRYFIRAIQLTLPSPSPKLIAATVETIGPMPSNGAVPAQPAAGSDAPAPSQSEPRTPPTDEMLRNDYGLTDQEIRVARLLGERRHNDEIATVLDISPHTVRHHVQSVRDKLGVSSRDDVALVLMGMWDGPGGPAAAR